MKLLFDQNLSFRLVAKLQDVYPDSTHVRMVGLSEAPDLEVWNYASSNGLTMVSKDDDFRPVPAEVKTISVPLGLNYFHPSGFFAGVVGTYVDQEVNRSNNSLFAQGDDNFFLADVSVGYRFAKRRGIASLGIKNLFDKEFNYQDDSYREFSEDATTGPYFPDRLIMGRVTLNF